MPDTRITEIQTALNQLHVVTKLGNELIAITSRFNDVCPKCRETALVITKLQEASLWLSVVAGSLEAQKRAEINVPTVNQN
jgi:hypothetical protein